MQNYQERCYQLRPDFSRKDFFDLLKTAVQIPGSRNEPSFTKFMDTQGKPIPIARKDRMFLSVLYSALVCKMEKVFVPKDEDVQKPFIEMEDVKRMYEKYDPEAIDRVGEEATFLSAHFGSRIIERRKEKAATIAADPDYRRILYTTAHWRGGRTHENAEDILSKLYMNMVNPNVCFTFYEDPAHMRNYLLKAIGNIAISFIRQQVRQKSDVRKTEYLNPDTPWLYPKGESAEEEALANMLGEEIINYLSTEPLVAMQIGGMSQSEVARVTGTPLGTVKTRKRIFKEKLGI